MVPLHLRDRLFIPAILIALGAVAVWFYAHSNAILRKDIQDRLKNNATLAAMQFSGEEIDQIQDESDRDSPLFEDLVTRARNIRESLPNVTFVYVMRKTVDPHQLSFVIEDDMLDSFEELDDNKNGTLEPDEETVAIGELFDISEIPAMQTQAFEEPSVDEEVTHDVWGSWISAYAPIRNAEGEAVAILGIDMSAEDFTEAQHRVFSPVALFLIMFAVVLIAALTSKRADQKRILALQAEHERQRELVMVASDTIGTPISILRWWYEMMDEGLKEKDTAKAKKEIKKALDRLSQVMKNLDSILKRQPSKNSTWKRLVKESEKKR